MCNGITDFRASQTQHNGFTLVYAGDLGPVQLDLISSTQDSLLYFFILLVVH